MQPAHDQRRMIRRTLQRLRCDAAGGAAVPDALRAAQARKDACDHDLSRPAWQRSALDCAPRRPRPDRRSWPAVRAALRRGDYRAAHRAARATLRRRGVRAFPLNASRRGRDWPRRSVQRISLRAGGGAPRARTPSSSGRYDLLGYRGLQPGPSPDWHADVVHGRRSPLTYWAAVPYLDPAAGDHKVIWELNRHQHWLFFGRAHALTGDRRFYDAFQRAARTTGSRRIRRSSAPTGRACWSSRSGACRGSGRWSCSPAPHRERDREPWIVDLLRRARPAADAHRAQPVALLQPQHAPHRRSAGALRRRAARCPSCGQRAARGDRPDGARSRRPRRQIRADGGHAELSAHYHRYSTDFYLLAARVAQRAQRPRRRDLRRGGAHARRATCARSATTPATGRSSATTTAGSCSRSAAGRPKTAAIRSPPRRSSWTSPRSRSVRHPKRRTGSAAPRPPRAMPVESAHWPSTALDRQRLLRVAHRARRSLVFDAGPHGFLNGGHAHADALSLTLDRRRPSAADRPRHRAPTRWTAELRDRFRSTMMHNTVVLGRPVAVAARAAHSTGAPARPPKRPIWRVGHGLRLRRGHARRLCAVASHPRGPRGARHRLVDSRPRARRRQPIDAENFWHIHPSWTVSPDERARLPSHVGRRRAGASPARRHSRCSRRARTRWRSGLRRTARSNRRRPEVADDGDRAANDRRDVHSRRHRELARHLAIEDVRLASRPGRAGMAAASASAGSVARWCCSRPSKRTASPRQDTAGAVACAGAPPSCRPTRASRPSSTSRAGRSEAVLVNGALVALVPRARPRRRCRAASRCCGWPRAQWPRPCMRSQGRPSSGCRALRCNGSRFNRACVASPVSPIRRRSNVRHA